MLLSEMEAALARFKEQPSDSVIATSEERSRLNVSAEGRESLWTNESADRKLRHNGIKSG